MEIVKSSDNKYGDIIRVVLLSGSGAEGINFKNVRYVHLMEPFWNYSRIK